MQLNRAPKTVFTHEGAVAQQVSNLEQLKRTVMACMLWESGFYESGETMAARIKRLVPLCEASEVAELARDARDKQKLRHVPLLLCRELARYPSRWAVSETLAHVIQRADELAEFLAMYWAEGKKPLAKQVKKGLAKAFLKFNEYQLAKYNRDNAVKLKDVLFMCHAKPANEEQAALWKRLANNELVTPDTWEVALSGGADKKEVFERLLREGKLGYMALLRNLRNMQQAGVDMGLVFLALQSGAEKSKALPFRYIAAARAVPAWEMEIDKAMQMSMRGLPKMQGTTAVLIDVSGSMDAALSAKSDLTRLDAAAALAVLVRGLSEDCRVFTFSHATVEVPPRNGMALVDAIHGSQQHMGTYLGAAINHMKAVKADRLIVITDEQSHDAVGSPHAKGYMINVACNQHGVGYGNGWAAHISGFSEAVVQYIQELEKGVEL